MISFARCPRILEPSPKGKHVTVLSPRIIRHISTSRLGPLSDPTISLRIGAPFQIVSIYSNRTLDCLNAAPTTTIFLLGMSSARIIAYSDNIKLFPKPRDAISMGNFLPHISCSIKDCAGSRSMLKICLQINEKYSGRPISQVSLR